jgi:ABC-type nitrate/sulfonate/bicarbonate transport system permease component
VTAVGLAGGTGGTGGPGGRVPGRPVGPAASRAALGLTGLLAALAAWQATSLVVHNPIYPSATSALSDIGTMFTGGNLASVVGVSLVRLGLGFGLSGLLGVGLGLLLGYSRTARDYLSSVVDFLRSIPFPLVLPLLVLLAGLGTSTVVLLVVLTALWPVLVTTADAAASVDPLVHDVVRACKLSRARAFRRVLVPAILPEILAGLRVAVGVSLAGLVIAEMIGSSNGIGYFIVNAESSYDSRATFAGVVVLGGIGWLADTAFLAVERRALRGRPS